MKYIIKEITLLLLIILAGNIEHKAQTFSLQDTSTASHYLERGNAFIKTAKYDSAIYFISRAKEIYGNLGKQFDYENTWLGYLGCSNKIGLVLILQGNYDSSHVVLLNTLKLGLEKFGENNSEVAQSFYYLGNVSWYKGNYDKALENYIKSLSIRLQILGEAHIDIADNYNGIGIIYAEKSDHDKALEYFEKSLKIKIHILGESHPQVAVSYNNIGNILKDKNDLEKALELHNKALSIRLQQLGENHPQTASSYSNIGLVYYKKGEYEKALEMHHKSLELRLKLLGVKHFLVATNYNNIGLAYWKLKQYDQSLENHRKSLEIKEQLFGKDHNDVAKSYMNIGLIYYETGKDSLALKNYNEALAINLKLLGKKHVDVAQSYQNITQVYLRRNDLINALNYSQKTLSSLIPAFNDTSLYTNPRIDDVISEPDLLNALKTKALIFSLMDSSEISNLEMAYSTYQLAAKLIDKMRTGYRTEGSKLFLGETTTNIYDQAINVSLKLYALTRKENYRQQAFVFAEKSKAAVLQEELSESDAKKFAGLPDSLLEKEKQLRIDLAFFDTQLQNESQKTDSRDSIKLLEYENQLFSLKNKFEQMMFDIEKNYSEYYQLKYQTHTASVDEIQNYLPDKTALLEYFVGDSTIYIFSVTKSSFDVSTLRKPLDFQELIKDYYSSIVKSESEKYIKSSVSLSKLLIEPVIHTLSSIESLIIIPHDLLYKVPFEALLTAEPSLKTSKPVKFSSLNYLITEFVISYHYSSNLYYSSISKKSEPPEDHMSLTSGFIGFAPVFPKNEKTGYTLTNTDAAFLSSSSEEILRSSITDGKTFNELTYSEWEVKSILEIFNEISGSNTGAAYLYSDADEETFKNNISKFEIIHIASHSLINEEHPDISGVVFAQPTDSSEREDGILYAGESYNLELNSSLVVLSSCESGLGKLIRGEGLMALTRGFLYSGTNNIIFSLWKVPDKPTSELMIEFYREAFSGRNYNESLRLAKLKMIKNEITARPRSWASFILVGSN